MALREKAAQNSVKHIREYAKSKKGGLKTMSGEC
jgi:hypothetical protein